MTKEEFNDMVLYCTSNNISVLYVSETLMADIRNLLNDKSNSAGIRLVTDGKTVCSIFPYDYDISDYLKDVTNKIKLNNNIRNNQRGSWSGSFQF